MAIFVYFCTHHGVVGSIVNPFQRPSEAQQGGIRALAMVLFPKGAHFIVYNEQRPDTYHPFKSCFFKRNNVPMPTLSKNLYAKPQKSLQEHHKKPGLNFLKRQPPS